jgi:hypothetical protein
MSWKVRHLPLLEKGQGLELSDFKAFAAANVAAGDHVVAANHVGLGFGEAGPVALVGIAWQLSAFAPDNPVDDVVAGLAAMGANEGVSFLFVGFREKFAFFHHLW